MWISEDCRTGTSDSSCFQIFRQEIIKGVTNTIKNNWGKYSTSEYYVLILDKAVYRVTRI
jgi:hypothetical protein